MAGTGAIWRCCWSPTIRSMKSSHNHGSSLLRACCRVTTSVVASSMTTWPRRRRALSSAVLPLRAFLPLTAVPQPPSRPAFHWSRRCPGRRRPEPATPTYAASPVPPRAWAPEPGPPLTPSRTPRVDQEPSGSHVPLLHGVPVRHDLHPSQERKRHQTPERFTGWGILAGRWAE